MFNLGAGEITVILLLALIVIGPSKLPDLASGLGKLIREIRKVTSDVKNEITIDESFRKPFEELRDAVTLHPDELKRRDQIKKATEEAKKRAEAELARVEAEKATEEATLVAAAVPAALEAAAEPAAVGPEAAAAEASPAILPPVAPPVGTVARTIQGVPPAPREENAPSAAPSDESGSAPFAAGRPTPSAAIMASVPPAGGSAPRLPPPVSSLEGDRTNATQTLSEKDLLAARPPIRRPPPLPGLDRHPPVGRSSLPRVPPPTSSLTGDRANATQTLSEKDLLLPGASKPPPLPGAKKS